jgi:geranylgeranyl diphosphate synthase type II
LKRDAFRVWRLKVDQALAAGLPSSSAPRLRQAMRYSLLAGGKRMRPLLLLAAGQACGAEAGQLMDAACAFECIHTYSLIHDDLPALDNDDLRRGKPTNHKVFGEAMAILAGDGLLTLAFEWMARQGVGLRPENALEAIRLLARAAGLAGMVGGQVLDLEGEGKAVSAARLVRIHAGKTGALLAASVECGAVLAGASGKQRKALAQYGRHVGLAFQIADDILNVSGDARKLGKKTGSDAAHGKATYPALFGLEKSRALARKELQLALGALASFGDQADPLRDLASMVVEREN